MVERVVVLMNPIDLVDALDARIEEVRRRDPVLVGLGNEEPETADAVEVEPEEEDNLS